jgi:hypothetical protein
MQSPAMVHPAQTQPPDSSLQRSLGPQLRTPPPRQVLAWHWSPTVQTSPSSQALPFSAR